MRKLYYEDPHMQTFQATVTGCTAEKSGFAVTLDASAFYPEGGGQDCDTGTLADSKVLSVRESGEEVIHLCDKPLPVGSTVQGAIDWERRFRLMQQHTGEHMVSGVIHKRYGYHNVGFHMGTDVITIDFDGPIPADALAGIEEEVNRAIWQNLPVRCWYPSQEELPTVPYRRKKDLTWPVRIVEIPGIDLCACCGTHVRYTGEIGLVKLLSCVKFHEGVRIEMVCGSQAMALLSCVFEQNKLVSQAFSAKIQQTGTAAQRMNEALAAEKFRATNLEKRLFTYIAQSYAGHALALHFEDTLSSAANRELCDAIADQAAIAATCAGNDDAGYSFCIISHSQDIRALGSSAIAALNGRGGGKPNAVQGSFRASRQEIENFFSQLAEKPLP